MNENKIDIIEDPLRRETNSKSNQEVPHFSSNEYSESLDKPAEGNSRKFEKKSFWILMGIFSTFFAMKQLLSTEIFFVSEFLICLTYSTYYVFSEGLVQKYIKEFIIGIAVLFLIGLIPIVGKICLALIFIFVLIMRFRLMVNLMIVVLISLIMIFFLFSERDLIISFLPITTGDVLYFALSSYLSYAFTIRAPLKTAIFNVSIIGISMGLFAALIWYYLHAIYDNFKADIINPEDLNDRDRNGTERTKHMYDFTRPFSK